MPGGSIAAIDQTIQIHDDIPKEIALGLDDVPLPGTVLHGGGARTKKIISVLQETACPAVGILATGAHATTATSMNRLQQYGKGRPSHR